MSRPVFPVLGLVLALGLGAFLVLRDSGSRDAARDALAPGASASDDVAGGPASLSAPERRVADTERAASATESAVDEPRDDAERASELDALLAALAAELAERPLYLPTWDKRVRASAHELDAADLARLQELLAEPATELHHALSAAELLRQRQEIDRVLCDELPPAAVGAFLAQLGSEDEDALLPMVAARALAGLGPQSARNRLVQDLLHGEGAVRSTAVAGLRFARDPYLALQLSEVIASGVDARSAGLLLDAMRGMGNAAAWTQDASARQRIGENLRLVAEGEDEELTLRARALNALPVWSPESAGEILAGFVRAGGSSSDLFELAAQALGTSELGDAGWLLSEALIDPALTEEERRVVAAAWAHRASRQEPERDFSTEAVHVLVGTADGGADGGAEAPDRRRAILALGSLTDDPSARAALEELVRGDDDPTIRKAAVLALRRGGEAERALLEEIAATDPAETVRRLAQQALDNWGG